MMLARTARRRSMAFLACDARVRSRSEGFLINSPEFHCVLLAQGEILHFLRIRILSKCDGVGDDLFLDHEKIHFLSFALALAFASFLVGDLDEIDF